MEIWGDELNYGGYDCDTKMNGWYSNWTIWEGYVWKTNIITFTDIWDLSGGLVITSLNYT